MSDVHTLVPGERIESKIYLLRGKKVMFDHDLAELYGVETKVLNQAVQRNSERFPDDFMFKLTVYEAKSLKSQFVTSNVGRGGRRKRLRLQLEALEKRYDEQFSVVFDAIRRLLDTNTEPPQESVFV